MLGKVSDSAFPLTIKQLSNTSVTSLRQGYDVVGVDVNESYVESLNVKSFKTMEPRVEEFLSESTHFRATTSLTEGLDHSNLIFILVDTPSTGGDRHYDVSRLGTVLNNINNLKVTGKHVVVGCTVMPGYCLKVGNHLLRDCTDTSLSYNPEFIQQGDIIRGFLNPDMVLIGEGSLEAGDALEAVYNRTCTNKPKICRMTPSSAEIAKISVNCFITTKISYANMIGDIADATEDADKYEILKAVGEDSRIGGKYLLPGYGFGGPCFPRCSAHDCSSNASSSLDPCTTTHIYQCLVAGITGHLVAMPSLSTCNHSSVARLMTTTRSTRST